MSKHQKRLMPFEGMSITVSQTSQDAYGNRTSRRTYCSTIKKVQRIASSSKSKDSQEQTLDRTDKHIFSKSPSTKTKTS